MNASVESVCPTPMMSRVQGAPEDLQPRSRALQTVARFWFGKVRSALTFEREAKAPPIAHVRIDSFYAAVEQANNPRLRGKAVLLVGGGVVASASPEAQYRGVAAGMTVRDARRCCPTTIVVPGDYARYIEYAARVGAILRTYAPTVEMTACGSFYLDFGDAKLPCSRLEAKLRGMQSEVLGQTGLNAAVGAGRSRMVAALAARQHRPCGLRIVVDGEEQAFLAPFPIEQLRGLGQNHISLLRQSGMKNMGELQRIPKPVLAALFGAAIGHRIWNLARGHETTDSVGMTTFGKATAGSEIAA